MHDCTLKYLFPGETRTYHLALKQRELPLHEAALHLLQLHFGDVENGLVMPAADATAQEILGQAERVGLTQIEVFDRKRALAMARTRSSCFRPIRPFAMSLLEDH